jgi:hypothetical protein
MTELSPEAGSVAVGARRLRRPLAAVLAGVLLLVLAGLGVLIALNPSTVRAQPANDPNELLEDASFDLAAGLSAWQPVAGSAANAYRQLSGNATLSGSGHGIVRGTIRQDVPLPPVDGRSYRAVVAVRGAGAKGVLRVQTACAAGEERAETHFTAVADWREVSATLSPMNGALCSLRVEIASLDGSPIAVDRGSFADAGLENPSFERGGIGWSPTAGAALGTAPDPASFDGGAVARLSAPAPGGALVQDVELDRSSEPILAAAEVEVRSPSGSATVELQLREPCSDARVTASASVGSEWTPLRVATRRTPAAKESGVPPEPPGLIRPTGDPCSIGVAVVMRSAGTIEVDGASLELRSYNPASGSPAYKARLGTVSSDLEEDASDTTLAGNTPVVRDRDAARRGAG